MYAKYWSSLGRAAVYAYEATGDDAFLHLFVEAYEPLLEARIELGYPRRPAWAVEDNDQPDPSVAGRMALPACELLLLLRREPGFELSLGTRHDRYLASIIDCVAPFEPDWRPADPIGGSFAARAGGALLPFAATGPLGAALAYLHELTGERLYGERVAAMTSLFFSCCQADTERTYTWPTRPGASSLAAGGTAAQALELPVAAWRQRLGATPERMQALSHTFLERWLPSPEELSAAAAGGDRGPKLSLLRRIGAVSTGVLLSDSCPNVAEAFAARAALLEPLASPLWLRSGRPMVLALALLLRGRSTRGVI
jgi:hypothetical protein